MIDFSLDPQAVERRKKRHGPAYVLPYGLVSNSGRSNEFRKMDEFTRNFWENLPKELKKDSFLFACECKGQPLYWRYAVSKDRLFHFIACGKCEGVNQMRHRLNGLLGFKFEFDTTEFDDIL